MNTTRFLLFAIGLTLVAGWLWQQREREWAQHLLRPSPGVSEDGRLDRPGVRASERGTKPTRPSAQVMENRAGVLKKCQKDGKLLYTDQACPEGFTVAAVNGAPVNILPSTEPKTERKQAPAQGLGALTDAFDVAGKDRLKEKMLDATVNP